MSKTWMIRAGEGGCLIDDFLKGCIGVGWLKNVDITYLKKLDQIVQVFRAAYPSKSPKSLQIQSVMLHKFRSRIHKGDKVITYDTKCREYFLGTVAGGYRFEPSINKSYSHIRDIKWHFRFGRDELSKSSQNSLRSGLTVFLVKNTVLEEIQSVCFFKKVVGQNRMLGNTFIDGP